MSDPRRSIPRTDALLGRPEFVDAAARLGSGPVRSAIRAAQERVRQGLIEPDAVASVALETLRRTTSMRAVLNATGVVVHTNLGRAPLSDAAVAAMVAASGYTDLELGLATDTRTSRGRTVLDALLAAVPAAQDALVVNHGAAALVLAVTALADEVIVSRGELVEIGDGFRVGELVASTGARLVEVGATNRTHLRDYAEACRGNRRPRRPAAGLCQSQRQDGAGPETPPLSPTQMRTSAWPRASAQAVSKVHPSNFRIEGFAAEVGVRELADLCRERGVPLVVDIGSGLLAPDPALPNEPSASTALEPSRPGCPSRQRPRRSASRTRISCLPWPAPRASPWTMATCPARVPRPTSAIARTRSPNSKPACATCPSPPRTATSSPPCASARRSSPPPSASDASSTSATTSSSPRTPALPILAALPQPCTAAQAKEALMTTRRVAIPLLEHLDRLRWTRRLDASRRKVVR